MSSDVRYIQKALAGIEDLAVGASTVTQTRNGTSYTITKINATTLPYSGDAATDDFVSIKTQIDNNSVGSRAYTADTGTPAGSVNVSAAGVLQVESIAEKTTDAGVTIEDVLLKDGVATVTTVIGNVQSDLIIEKTSDAGVTIEGVLLKDSVVTKASGSLQLDSANGEIMIGSSTPVTDSILTLTSTTKAFTKPRMTSVEKNAISNPVEGMEVYDTTLGLPHVYRPTVAAPLGAWASPGASGDTTVTTYALTPGASVATDCSTGIIFTLAIDQNSTLANPTNVANGQTYVWIITQDATGDRSLDFGTYFSFQGNSKIELKKLGVTVIVGRATSTTTFVCSIIADRNELMSSVLYMLQSASKTSEFEDVLNFGDGFYDRYDTTNGIDTGNSTDVYFLAGTKAIVNDGIGGFFTKLYAGDGNATQSLTGLGFSPDFVWIKNRSDTDGHALTDTILMTSALSLATDSTAAAVANAANYMQSLDADGFTVGTIDNVNASGENYVAWCFECPEVQTPSTAGSVTPSFENINSNTKMSIIKADITGTGDTVGHNLGVAPTFMIWKSLDDIERWFVYHHGIGDNPGEPGDNPEDWALRLDNPDPQADNVIYWGDTAPTSTLVTLGSDLEPSNYIGYLFAEVPGFSKFGHYLGNGVSKSISGLGFEPEFLIIKNIDGAENRWVVVDNTRGATNYLFADDTAVEATNVNRVTSIDSDGFTVGSSGATNTNLENHVYMAFGAKGTANAMDMISEGQTVVKQPEIIEVYALYIPREAVTLNTDLILYVSRVSGAESQAVGTAAYWTQCTNLRKESDVLNTKDLIYGSADVSGQNAGTTLQYRWVTTETKVSMYGTWIKGN